MNQRRRSWSYSQFLAAGALAATLLVMMAPFRGSSGMLRLRTAGVLPLLSTASIAHGGSFQAFHSTERLCGADASQFRSATTARGMQRRSILVRKSAAPSADLFHQPRTHWRHLDHGARAALDQLTADWQGRALVIRGSGLNSGDFAELDRLNRVLTPGVQPGRAVLIGNGQGIGDGALRVRSEGGKKEPLRLYLAGDFHQQAASPAQWEALAEVLDYLELKRGRLIIEVVGAAGAAESPRRGAGPLFPAEGLLRVLARPGS